MIECITTLIIQAWNGDNYQDVKCYECTSLYEVQYKCDEQLSMVDIEGRKFWIIEDEA